MTQVIAAGNWTYALVVADRRFTFDGKLRDETDDERNKVVLVATPTARLAVAFCGLAWLNSFRTESWLSNLLLEALRRGGGTPDLNWMCGRANADFARLPNVATGPEGTLDGKCVWVVLAGFVAELGGVLPIYANLSNAHQSGRGVAAGPFHVEAYGPTRLQDRDRERAFAMSFGAARVHKDYVDDLKRVGDGDRPAWAAVGAALRTMRHARLGAARDVIGGRFGAAIVWSDPERQPEGWYFGKRGAATHFMPTLVTRHGIAESFAVDRRTVPVGRNAPCSCGSGRAFRGCCGATSSGVRGTPP